MRLPFAAAAVGFALAEACVTLHVASAAELTWPARLTAALAAAAVVLAFGGALLWPLDALLRTRGARALGHGLHRALAAEGSVALAWLSGAGAPGAAVLGVLALAPAWNAVMSPAFAHAFSVLCAVAGAGLLLLAAAAVAHPLALRLAPRSPRAQALDRVVAALVPGLALAAGLGLLVEPRYAVAPLLAAALVALACAGAWRARSAWRPALAVMIASVALVAALERLPASAGELLAYRTPYAALALGLGQRVLDRDGDGAAAWLLGGDCNDRDAAVNPRARDVPANRIDENCSGSDAPRYTPPPPVPATSVSTPHDLVLILVDALRPDRLSINGYKRKTSRNIDKLAREGTHFRNAYTTAPSTRFAMASLFTGRDVRRLRWKDTGGNNFSLLSGAPTLARRLSAVGYHTIGYTVSYVIHHNKGTGQGFSSWRTPWPIKEWQEVGGKKATLTTQKVLADLESLPPEKRLFLYAHYDCTHAPYRKYPPFDFGDRPSDVYDSSLAHCDEQIAQVLAALRKRPSWDRTAVMIVSDHGEMIGEHGLTSHGYSLFENDVRVAMIARVPNAAPRVVDTPVQLHWVAPTLLELAGLRPDPADDASSLLGVITGRQKPVQRPLFMFTELQRGSTRYFASAVLEWPHKLIRDHRTGTLALYDVVKDKREKKSLIETKPSVAGHLSDLLEGYEAWAVP